LARLEKPDHPVSYSRLSDFGKFSEQEQDMSYTQRFGDPRCFEARKRTKRHQGAKMEEIQAKSQGHKNQTIRFWILEYPIFPEQIDAE
jgi:hypothetical protein